MSGAPAFDLAVLACPRCGGSLEPSGRWLQCRRCRAPYEVISGIPDLLPWSGGAPGPEWTRWREKLGLLQEWRSDTWDGTSVAQQRQEVADTMAERFFQFARIPQGRVLEIGCGSAQLRRHLPGREYWGLDPLLGAPGSPACDAAPPDVPALVRGVGERLPFVDGSFHAAILCETLDHALDPARVLRETRRVLVDDGVLAVMQSVRGAEPRPSPVLRFRVAAGRLKARLLGKKPRMSDARTKMVMLRPDEVPSLVRTELEMDQLATYGQSVLVRALKRPPQAPPRWNV
ncbi:MAG: methyltransferase domain-containing protein [Candidatus Polarisedimenticolia bacterium]